MFHLQITVDRFVKNNCGREMIEKVFQPIHTVDFHSCRLPSHRHRYRYHAERVPLHTSFKPRQGAERASTHCHVLPHIAMCSMAPDPASLLGRALVVPRVPRLWIPHPHSGGLRRCYVPHGNGLSLPAQEGSGAATCLMTPDPPPCSGRLQFCHVPRGSRPCLPTQEGSGVATCPAALKGS
jgi:hypothetical protein